MNYLNKLLNGIKKNPALFKTKDIILTLGLTTTEIKNLKKSALENQLITQSKQNYFLTPKGEEYLTKNPLIEWKSEKFPLRPNINVEYLKSEKTPSVLTKAMRLYAKNLLEKEPLKDFSLEKALSVDIENSSKLVSQIENELLNKKRIKLKEAFDRYINMGLTKSLTALIILKILTDNLESVAIYEKAQFQLKFNQLMFDRMVACPENFEIQQTELKDEYLLKDISKIILNKKSNNILEITKGLYTTIKTYDKYTMNTQNLSDKTIRLRNIIINAKDPISLFERDIPKALSGKVLKDCERDFLDDLKLSLNELKYCTENLVKSIKKFIFEAFQAKTKEELSQRFLEIKDFLNEKELKILFNTITDINVTEELWTNRIATFVNTFRVPKDWSDEDYANFKVKIKELAFKFSILEATIGTHNYDNSKNFKSILDTYIKLSHPEQMTVLRKLINI